MNIIYIIVLMKTPQDISKRVGEFIRNNGVMIQYILLQLIRLNNRHGVKKQSFICY